MKTIKLIKKLIRILPVIVVSFLLFVFFYRDGMVIDHIGIHIERPFTQVVHVPNDYSTVDRNNNGIADPIDIVNTARKEVVQRTFYKSAYYDGGYPPDKEGVCTDVVWRGLQGADISFKELLDQDIAENSKLYPRVNENPDPNIDFRRVPNQYVYLERHTQALTTELIEGDVEN